MHHLPCLSVDKDYKNKNIYFYIAEMEKVRLSHIIHHFLYFDYVMRLTLFDFL